MKEFKRMTPEEEAIYRKKKTIKSFMGILVIVAIVLIALIVVLQLKDSMTFKFFINDVQYQVSDDFLITTDEDETYVAAKELSEILGYRYQNGDYGSFSKDTESAYIQNDYEVASFTIGSNELKKYIKVNSSLNPSNTGISVLSENGYCETTTMELPVIEENGIVYIPLKCINDICNSTSITDNNSLYVYDLNYLINLAKTKAVQYKFDTISGDYENLRALPYGMMVVVGNDSYGVISLYTGESIIGAKYNQIVFNQNVKEFLVKTKRTVGILNSEGESVIDINQRYEDISVLSDKLGLYLVSEDNQYGVLNREGKEVVYVEYDSVGINQEISTEFSIKTDDLIYIPYDKIIIAEDDGEYEIYDVEKSDVLHDSFSGIGCIPKNLQRNLDDEELANQNIKIIDDAEKVLLIDIELENGNGIKGIVLEEHVESVDAKRYGIYDSITGRLIIPCSCTQIYSITKNGRTNYYMEYNGEQLELVEYLETQELGLEKYE